MLAAEEPVTNIVEFETCALVKRQAREWLIRLDGDQALTSKERDALGAWMNRNPMHREELMRISRLWRQANVLTELAAPLRVDVRRRKLQRRVRAVRVLAVAASVALVPGVLFWWGLRWLDHAANGAYATNGTYGTATGRQQAIALSDGSPVPAQYRQPD